MTPTLSVDAVQERLTLVWLLPVCARPVGVDGGVVSVHADVEAVTVALPETFPAASFASTASVCDVLQVRPENVADRDVVEPASVPST